MSSGRVIEACSSGVGLDRLHHRATPRTGRAPGSPPGRRWHEWQHPARSRAACQRLGPSIDAERARLGGRVGKRLRIAGVGSEAAVGEVLHAEEAQTPSVPRARRRRRSGRPGSRRRPGPTCGGEGRVPSRQVSILRHRHRTQVPSRTRRWPETGETQRGGMTQPCQDLTGGDHRRQVTDGLGHHRHRVLRTPVGTPERSGRRTPSTGSVG